jgi:CDP-diglyceride synthetase
LFSIEDVDVVATIPSLPHLLAVSGAAASIGGTAIGVLVGKASTWRKSCEDFALGATVGGVASCLLVFLVYSLVEVVGLIEAVGR